MSMTDLAVLSLKSHACPKCGQPPGRWCRTKGGYRASYLHTGRTRAVYEAWRIGFREATETAHEVLHGSDDGPERLARLLDRHHQRWAS